MGVPEAHITAEGSAMTKPGVWVSGALDFVGFIDWARSWPALQKMFEGLGIQTNTEGFMWVQQRWMKRMFERPSIRNLQGVTTDPLAGV